MAQNLDLSIKQLLKSNRRVKGNFQYTIPSPETYPYQWLWDSCFHAIVLADYAISDAKKEILSLLSKQFENGMIPHIIFWEKQNRFGNDHLQINWGREDVSTITQPPMIAYAVLKIYETDHDKDFLQKVYPKLLRFYDYLINERDPRRHHLAGIINPDESGEDNSPRFDIPLNLAPIQSLAENSKKRLALVEKNYLTCNFDAPFCMKNFFWVKDVPFNVILIENMHALSTVAGILGDKYHENHFFNERNNYARAMRKLMLEDGIYWATYGKDYKKIKVKTWAMFAPLWAGLYTKDEANKLIDNHLLAPEEFWTNYPIPTTAKSEPSYQPVDGFWRGSTWVVSNWLICKGLERYGREDLATHIKHRTREMIERAGFREYFNPETGEGYGARNFTWSALLLDMD